MGCNIELNADKKLCVKRETFIKKHLDNLKKHWQLYVFLVLPLIYLFVFCYYPMFGLQIAFKDFNASSGIWGSEWIGFDHFKKFFSSYQFSRVVSNTLILSFYNLIAGFPLPIIFALCVNAIKNSKLQKFFQNVSYCPHFISTVVLVGMVIQILNPKIGVYGMLMQNVFGKQATDLLASPNTFRHVYVLSGIWQNMGWNSIIYIAALAGVDQQLHEAAYLDGANRFKRILYVDLPAILPTITIILILNTGSIMTIGFEKIFLMQNDLNLRASEVISTYVYKIGLAGGGGDFGYATAIGLFNSVINLIMIVVVNTISKKVSETSLW